MLADRVKSLRPGRRRCDRPPVEDTRPCWRASREQVSSPQSTARTIGLTGPAARASGVDRDVRRDHPSGMWRFAHIPVSTWRTGDVFARAYVRGLEMQRSFAFIEEQLASLPPGDVRVPLRPLARGAFALRTGRGLARRHLPRGDDRPAGQVFALQGGRPLVPQLVRSRPGHAGPADLRLPAVQQELQSLLLRARPVRVRVC